MSGKKIIEGLDDAISQMSYLTDEQLLEGFESSESVKRKILISIKAYLQDQEDEICLYGNLESDVWGIDGRVDLDALANAVLNALYPVQIG